MTRALVEAAADPVPEVLQAIAASGKPFDPVGSLQILHPKPTLPPCVVIVRKGARWFEQGQQGLAMAAAGASLFVAFENQADFDAALKAFGAKR